MRVGRLFSINSELPVRLKRFRLDPVKAKEFNEGVDDKGRKKFERSDYKYLYELAIDRPPMYIQLATPDFKQVLYSIKVLWNAVEGKPYNRHGHPVVMQAYDIAKAPLDGSYKALAQRQEAQRNFQKALRKNRRKQHA